MTYQAPYADYQPPAAGSSYGPQQQSLQTQHLQGLQERYYADYGQQGYEQTPHYQQQPQLPAMPPQSHPAHSMGMPSLTMDGSQTPYAPPIHAAPWPSQQPPVTQTRSPQIRYDTRPLPPPTSKVAYEPPVFQTFQDRKRAKEMALLAQMQAQTPSQPPVQQRPLSSPVGAGSRGLPLAPGSGGMRAPPALAGSHSPLVGSPTPLLRSALPPGSQPLPTPPQPPPRSTSSRASSTLPGPLQSSPHLPIVSVSTSTCSTPSPRSSSPLPRPPSRSQTLPSSSSVPPSTSDPRLRTSGRPLPIPAPLQATLERSDTLTSVKSLDLDRTRPLPRPPVGVNTSKSLDRGIPPVGALGGRTSRPVSLFTEEMEELGTKLTGMGVATGSPTSSPAQTIPSPTAVGTRTLPRAPSVIQPVECGVSGPAQEPHGPHKSKPLPTPTMSFPEVIESPSGDNKPVTRPPTTPLPGPAASFSGPPIIAVSTSDTRDENDGQTSFTVPSFSFDIDEPSPSSPHSVAVGTPSSVPVLNLPSFAAEPVASGSRVVPTQLKHSGSAILCAHCSDPIIGRIVSAMGKRWHPACFMCAECGELLEHVSSYESDGKAYCHLDYHNKYAHVCFHCKTAIVDPRFVTLDLPELGRRYYHELHFFCGECGDPFLDPSKSSAPGTKRAQRQATDDDSEDEDETNNFVFHKGHAFCERCHNRLHKPKCRACRQPIPDIALSAMGAKWHKECFVCVTCSSEFKNDLFFPKDGAAFCTECYEQLLAQS